MSKKTALLWFRQDLRLDDNPALCYAVQNEYDIIPVYILDDENAGQWKMGGASRWWLHQSLNALNETLGGNLRVFCGCAEKIIGEIIDEHKIDAVFWNRCYEPWRIKRDQIIKETLTNKDITAESFNGSLLWEPWTVLKDDKTPYKVFTPYYKRGCLKTQPDKPVEAPEDIPFIRSKIGSGDINRLGLMPKIQWYKDMQNLWDSGEKGAHERLNNFLDEGLHGYKEKRDNPALPHVSRLSPYLHHGEISPRRVWYSAKSYAAANQVPEKDIDHFCSELGWREFSYYLLYHFPHITWENLQEKFNAFPWVAQESNDLERWRRGQTGIPIVDAAMRQLWSEGWMHNRTRMIVGSLLVKNLLIHWHRGEEWFWDCLVDADLASNSASWQWIAGCGADAAPYFRIFNPVTQGEKFDTDGKYVRKYVPELAEMPDKYLHKPWEAPPMVLKAAGITLGENYPHSIVDLKQSRERALKAFETTKKDA